MFLRFFRILPWLFPLIVFPGCGHAPALMDAAQIDVVRNWLKG